ncbi:two component transcriptional regulator, winged helix family [Oscillochloris trichoides DG-6]|uniref:Two component transcriptional regulator, winged helix family n=1 Tax=Oscillochloris trichoides DG-6 TaxID=765420 RepID=E1IIJ7_9CHLR|nr:response regulator transcription factor [Oscillochloris trichoides]EFO78987.1 two component transcriptional regulator, winged helix family [Oscillochloris trichoides DG-6]
MSDSANILVVDDEQNIRLTLSALLRRSGYTITTASNGEEAVSLFQTQSFDLMLVDLQMPGISGIQVVEALRNRGLDTEVIVLTGHGSLESAIEGIHHGIFDYMLKTSDPAQIVERVAAALAERAKRQRQSTLISTIGQAAKELVGDSLALITDAPASPPSTTTPVTSGHERVVIIGQLQLDTWHQTATLSERSLNLTPTEFRLLLCLAEHSGQMLSYTQLVRCAQGYETSELEAGELIKPHIHHLRQKIEPDPSTPRYLLNVRGKGYILQID